MSKFKRVTAALTLATFISTQITGCLTIPKVSGSLSSSLDAAMGHAKNALAAGGPSYKGAFSPEQALAARTAQEVFAQVENGQASIGYTMPEYEKRLSRFKAAKAVIESNPRGYTQAQFLELSSALASLLTYVDAIETIDQQPKSAYTIKQGAQQSYQIDPGERASFSVSGYCLQKEVIAPARGDHLQLLPIRDVWPESLIPAYQRLIATHSATKTSGIFSTSKNADLQAAIWALQSVKDGNLTSSSITSLSGTQMALLAQAGMTPQTMLNRDNLMASASNMAIGMAKNAAMSAVKSRIGSVIGEGSGGGAGGIGQQIASGAAGQVLQNLPVDASAIMGNASILQNNQLLAQSLQGWLSSQQNGQRPPVAPPETGYTSLARDVAAYAAGTQPLAGTMTVVNLGGEPFEFRPADYILNARNNTQPIGVAEWRQTEARDVAKVVKSSEDKGIAAALLEDLKDMGMKEAFKEFFNEDGRALAFAKSQFRSRTVQNLLTKVPVVGNILNAGMLITGRNLDGDPMDAWDYAGAALGLLPVAGNLASALGPGARILARELTRAGSVAQRNPQIEYAIDVLGSDTAEYAMDNGPAWVREQYATISRKVVGDFPETSRYVEQNRIKL